jgi:ribosome-associated protein
MIRIGKNIFVPEKELEFQFIRSSGPGGQNVNKVATAVQLRFDAAHSPSLPEDIRERLMALAGKRLNEAGVIVIDARRFRTQERNRRDAVDRLAELLRRATARPKPRRKTVPGRAAVERRLAEKRSRSDTKRSRRRVSQDNDT